MNLLKQSKPQCLLYSAAMLLDMNVEHIIKILGHDGLEIINNAESPYCYKGVHIQEIQTVANMQNMFLAPIQLHPVSNIGNIYIPLEVVCKMSLGERFELAIQGRKGVLIGKNTLDNGHAVAFDDGIVYDPNGIKYPIENFIIQEAWILINDGME